MTNFTVLNSTEHEDVRIVTTRASAYGDSVMYAMTFPFEFRNVQADYPILFHQDAEGTFYPVALFGFEQGENLYLDDDGWHASYIPGMVRREPFLINYREAEQPGAPEQRLVAIDMDHPRVNSEEGELLFELGKRSQYLEEQVALLEALYEGAEHGKKFVAAMQEHDLIESVTVEVTLNDGSQNQLLGFGALNEEKIQALPGEALDDFNRRGYLMPMYMILASMVNVRTLIERKNLKEQGKASVSPF